MTTNMLLLDAVTLAGPQTKSGTFDRTKAPAGFYSFPTWKRTIQARRAESDRALDSPVRRTPVPVDNILAVLQPGPQNLAHLAGVAEVREKAKPGEEAVGVAGRILEALQ